MTSMTIPPNNTDRIAISLRNFTSQMEQKMELRDGFLTARVIGEFSAGKTRLLRELLGDVIPPALFPVSSLERQTKLQLEITYGDQAELTLVEREHDYSPPVTLKSFTQFPERDEIDDASFDPTKHRLRLALPVPHFILPNGDGRQEDKVPMRLFLIDTPGWNSGDDDIAEGEAGEIMTGFHNLGLVYVTNALRLDGAGNIARLRDFLKVLQDAEFLEGAHLIMVVTSCLPADQTRLKQRAEQHVMDVWTSLHNSPSSLTLHVLCVDFNGMNKQELQQFRDGFWQCLLAPLGEQAAAIHPWVSQIRHWPAEWDVRLKIKKSQVVLAQASNLLTHACQNDEFLAGMNMYRLIGLDASAMRQKLQDVWLRKFKCNDVTNIDETLDEISLDSQHPLSTWWQDYWIKNLHTSLAPFREFLKLAEQAINDVTPATVDLQKHMQSKLSTAYQTALASTDSSFIRLVHSAGTLGNVPVEKALATLLSLSVLQARYEDHYAMHMQHYQDVKFA